VRYFLNKYNGFTLVELIVVVTIVGVLAAVAIPKFLDATNKAKASEFPTQLAAMYSGEMAYQAERGTFATSLTHLKDSGCIDVPGTSRWFMYRIPSAGISTFVASAKVNAVFGAATSSDSAAIDQTNAKSATAALQKYSPNWR
jgi:prepilin-type N-terminal cleavage/methylation domain-containing protein